MKTKSAQELIRQNRLLKQKLVQSEKRNKELEFEKRKLISDWNEAHSTCVNQIKKLSNENQQLKSKRNL